MFGTATLRVRPLKLALLVDPNRPTQVRSAIRLASSLWGGAHFPIIPIYGRMPNSWREPSLRTPSAKEVVEGYIHAFDPDALVQFGAEPPSYVRNVGLKILKPRDVWADLTLDHQTEPKFGLGIFDVLEAIYEECFKYKAKFPTSVIIPSLPRQLGLYWASVFGEYESALQTIIMGQFSEPLEIQRIEASQRTFAELMNPSILFPRRVAGWGLSVYSGALGLGGSPIVFYMDAAETEDIIDYWNLRASGRVVIPLAKQHAGGDSARKLVNSLLDEARRAFRDGSSIHGMATLICSRNSTLEEARAFAKSLRLASDAKEGAEAPNFLIQHWYPRLWSTFARNADGGVADVYGDGESSIDIGSASDLDMRFRPLLPKFARSKLYRAGASCANEIDLRLYGASEHLAQVFPQARGKNLARAISGGNGLFQEWRIGRNGLVAFVSSPSRISWTVPSSESIFLAWLADHGWSAALSPPGVLAKQIYKRLEGNTGILANQRILYLLEEMNGGSPGGRPGSTNNSKLSLGREVPVARVKEHLKTPSGGHGIYEFLLSRGVFKLGLQSKCPTCLRYSWFALSELNESLICPKCLGAFPAAGNVDQKSPAWHYRTVGPFSVSNYAEGAYTVLLALRAITDRISINLRTTAIPSFTAQTRGNSSLEADFALFWRESVAGEHNDGLLFGECKTFGDFVDRDFERMRSLGEMFPGAILAFCTLKDELNRKEVAALTRLSKLGRKEGGAGRGANPVLILTGVELLSWQRPPDCWGEDLRARFSGVYNILSLCDATQQIYLGLSSLDAERRDRFERRMDRRLAQRPKD